MKNKFFKKRNAIIRKLPSNDYEQSKAMESLSEVTELYRVVRKKEQDEVHVST